MATKSLVDSGTCFPGRVMNAWLVHSCWSETMATVGDGSWLGSMYARRPGMGSRERRSGCEEEKIPS